MGDDAYAAIVAPFQDLADLKGGLWLEDGGGGAAIFSHPVMVVLIELVRWQRRGWESGEDGGGGKDGGEVGEVVGCDSVEGRWRGVVEAAERERAGGAAQEVEHGGRKVAHTPAIIMN